MKVLVTGPWLFRHVEEMQPDFPSVQFIMTQSPDEQLAAAADVEVIFGSVTDQLLAAAPRLKWVQAGGAGVDWMPRGLADTDIVVTNLRGAHAATIAEHTLGMLVYLARRFDDLRRAQSERVWHVPAPQPTVGLAGMTMGVIGLGNIGRAVAVRAHAFEMEVIAVDAQPVPQPEYVGEVRLLDGLDDLLRRADAVTVAVPKTDETLGMLGPRQLALMKPTAYLLVMSRGGIVDEPALIRMLRAGELAGAGLDVTATEPLPADSALWDAPNIFITPHISPLSALTGTISRDILHRNLSHYLAGEPLENLVDTNLRY